MSLTQDLEIYKAADELLSLGLRIQAQVPRAYRMAVGQRVSNECAEIMTLVARANAARGVSREQQLDLLLEHVEAAVVLLRAAYRLRIIPMKVWAESVELTDSVGKQAQGWLKATGRAVVEPMAPAMLPMQQGGDLFSAAPAA